MTQQKTYFDQISGRPAGGGRSSNMATSQHNSSMISKSKQTAEDTAGIEGNNVSQGDTIVNVNQKNSGASSGIFQSLTSMH